MRKKEKNILCGNQVWKLRSGLRMHQDIIIFVRHIFSNYIKQKILNYDYCLVILTLVIYKSYCNPVFSEYSIHLFKKHNICKSQRGKRKYMK